MRGYTNTYCVFLNVCGQLHQNHPDKQLKMGEFSNSRKNPNCNFNSIRTPYLQFHCCRLLQKWRWGGGGNPWYFHLSYKVQKSASCQKRGEEETASLTPTPDATCLWCKNTVCFGVFAWSQRTRQLIGAQKLWMRHLGAKSCFTVHATNELIHWQKSIGGGGGLDAFFDICFVTATYMYIILWIGCFGRNLSN